MNDLLVSEIVQQVLKQLQHPVVNARSQFNRSAVSQSNDVAIPLVQDAVVTADVLEQKVKNESRVQINARSLVTPAARDWLRENGVEWCRRENGATNPENETNKQRCKVLVVNEFSNLQTIVNDLAASSRNCWSLELANDNCSATEQTIQELCRSAIDQIVVVSLVPERIACDVNRNRRIRAAVIETASRLQTISQNMKTNCLCINPAGKSYFELRNLMRAIDQSL